MQDVPHPVSFRSFRRSRPSCFCLQASLRFSGPFNSGNTLEGLYLFSFSVELPNPLSDLHKEFIPLFAALQGGLGSQS